MSPLGRGLAVLAAVVLTCSAGGQADARSQITQAAALLGKRAFPEAMKILDSLAVDPAVKSDSALEADVTYHTGNAWFLQNEYPKALQFLERSSELCRGRADKSCESRALFRITQAHKNMGRYPVALEKGRELVAMAEALKNDDFTARTLAVLGSIQDLTGQYRAALESYERAERLFAGARTPAAIVVMNETAITHKNLGNFDAALSLYTRALEAQRAMGDRLNEAITLLNTANLYRTLGQDDRALELYQQSLAISRQLNERRGITINLNNFGDLMLSKGNTARALEMFGEVLQITQALGNRNEQAIALFNLGDVHVVRGELDLALRQYDEALAIQRAIGAKGRESRTLLAMADVRLKQGSAAAAAELSAQSLAIARETVAPDLEWRALYTGARAARAQNRPADAIQMLRASAAIVNDLRANVSTDTAKIGFVDSRQAVFHDLSGLLVDAGQVEQGLEAAEAGRARAFADLLAQRSVEGKPAERRQLESVRSAIDEARRAPATTARTGVRGGPLDERLTALRADNAELTSLLTAESPTASEIKDTVRRLRATVIEYLVTEDALYAWVVTASGAVHAKKIAVPGPKLSDAVRELRDLLGRDSEPGATPARLSALTRELDAWLVAPIAAWLPAAPTDQVIVVPHGPLAVLPFAALADKTGRPLMARHTLAFAPAVSVYRYTTAKRRPNGGSGAALVVADAAGPTEASMPPLPGAREEGRLVAKRLAPADVNLLVGADATESAFKRTAGTRRIVHVATHGLISADRPLRSSLLLAPGNGDDGYLRVDEIFGLPLSADLVVLSGCSTGLGQSSGDGIIGLGRAFLYAGTPSVVVSQWDVSDRATTYLMDQFYAALTRGRGPAEALRSAQMATRARYPHPALWAAFVAIGEPR